MNKTYYKDDNVALIKKTTKNEYNGKYIKEFKYKLTITDLKNDIIVYCGFFKSMKDAKNEIVGYTEV
jgi:hypothetical protein